MLSETQLADFQAALLELLAQDVPLEEIQRRLHAAPEFAVLRDYVDGFEPRMLAVAAELVKKWGRRAAI